MCCVGTGQIDIKRGCCKEINKHKRGFASNMLVAKKEKKHKLITGDHGCDDSILVEVVSSCVPTKSRNFFFYSFSSSSSASSSSFYLMIDCSP
jgi:hypothetical protein